MTNDCGRGPNFLFYKGTVVEEGVLRFSVQSQCPEYQHLCVSSAYFVISSSCSKYVCISENTVVTFTFAIRWQLGNCGCVIAIFNAVLHGISGFGTRVALGFFSYLVKFELRVDVQWIFLLVVTIEPSAVSFCPFCKTLSILF